MTPDRDDRALDELLQAVRDRFIARSDASFDFEAGLADVRERAGLPFARVPARRIPPGRGPLSAAVALVCEHVEDLVVVLDCVLLSGPLPDLAGSQIQRAAEILLRLRDDVAAGTASLTDAGSAMATARDALSQADLILRVERGVSLPEALATGPGGAGSPADSAGHLDRTDVPDQLDVLLRGLEHEVSEALAALRHDQADRRRPAQRPYGGELRRRNAGDR
jgi:hypothetical protein